MNIDKKEKKKKEREKWAWPKPFQQVEVGEMRRVNMGNQQSEKNKASVGPRHRVCPGGARNQELLVDKGGR